MWSGWALLLGTVMVGEAGTSAEERAGDFEGLFRSAVARELTIPEAVARKGRTYRYVFVGGFRSERMPGYFAQNMAELRALGVPRSRIHVIHPSSGRTTEENAEDVRAEFLKVAEEGPEKLVVIAHSRGACDALAFALNDPEFVEDRVEALFLVQGAFGGSGAADYVVGKGEPMDRRMALRHRIVGNLLCQVARALAGKSGLDVLDGLTREMSRAFWAKTLADHPEAASTVGKKTFYIRSSIEPSRLSFGRRAIAWYLHYYQGENDGMIALEDQSLPGLGTVVATLDAAHSDLTHKPPATNAPRLMRKALARSIFTTVGRKALDRSPELGDGSGPGLDRPEDAVPERQPGRKRPTRGRLRLFPSKRVVSAN